MMRIFLIALAILGVSSAFVTPMQRAQVVKPASPTFIFKMSEDPTQEKAPASDGTFYDDEVDLTPAKPALSNSMKERLIREASSGMDSEQKQTNVILYISVVIALLVAIGGSGILY